MVTRHVYCEQLWEPKMTISLLLTEPWCLSICVNVKKIWSVCHPKDTYLSVRHLLSLLRPPTPPSVGTISDFGDETNLLLLVKSMGCVCACGGGGAAPPTWQKLNWTGVPKAEGLDGVQQRLVLIMQHLAWWPLSSNPGTSPFTVVLRLPISYK
jgi:hypothetical protein